LNNTSSLFTITSSLCEIVYNLTAKLQFIVETKNYRLTILNKMRKFTITLRSKISINPHKKPATHFLMSNGLLHLLLFALTTDSPMSVVGTILHLKYYSHNSRRNNQENGMNLYLLINDKYHRKQYKSLDVKCFKKIGTGA